jgi:ribonuclease HI
MWNVSIVTEVTGEEATAKVYVYDACGQIRQKKNFRIERQGIPKYRAELAVLLEALKELKPGCRLVLKPMQMPVGSAIRLGWAEGWRKRGWKTAAGKPPREAELWEQIMERLDGHQIREVKTQEGQGQEEKR